MARNTTYASRIARKWPVPNSSAIRANALPTKPVVAAHEVAMWDDTRRVWDVRAKDALALRRAGLMAVLTQPAAAAVTTAKPNTEPIDLTGTSSTSSTNGDSDKENPSSRRPTTTAAAAASSRKPALLPRRQPTTTTNKGSGSQAILFRPNNTAGISKRRAATAGPIYPTGAAQRAVIVERQKQQRRDERARIDKLREGVDERLLACNQALHRRETSEEEEKSADREEAVYQMAKKLTKRGEVDAPKRTGWGYRMRY